MIGGRGTREKGGVEDKGRRGWDSWDTGRGRMRIVSGWGADKRMAADGAPPEHLWVFVAGFQDFCALRSSANMKRELVANPDSPKGRNLG